jgi:hypothetical protein
VQWKLLLLSLCSLFLVSIPYVYAADEELKVKTPYLEMQSDSIELTSMPVKVGPGGEGEIIITFTKNNGG